MSTLDDLMIDHDAERIAKYRKEKYEHDSWWNSLTQDQRIKFQEDLDAKNEAHDRFWDDRKDSDCEDDEDEDED